MIETYDPASGGTLLSAYYNGRRSAHSATLLADGRVLIAGGGFGESGIEDALLVDPANSIVVPAGSMKTGRAAAAAVLLADGRVLVTGGQGLQGIDFEHPTQDSAEIYDPRTNTFSPTGQMNQARSGHSMQLLPDGRVLVLGGWRIDPHASDEPDLKIIDVAHGTKHMPRPFTSGAAPTTAAFLANLGGKVPVTSAEIYDPKSGSFTVAAAPSTARDGCQPHAAHGWSHTRGRRCQLARQRRNL